MKSTIWTILSVEFSGIKYIHTVVHGSAPSDYRVFFYLLKLKLCTINSNSPLLPSPPPAPGKPHFYFLSLHIWPLWLCHVSGIIQYLSFCVWLTSLSIISWSFTHPVVFFKMFVFSENTENSDVFVIPKPSLKLTLSRQVQGLFEQHWIKFKSGKTYSSL